MSRTLGGGLVSHLATDTHTRCRMLRLDLVDGSVLAVTDHDRDIAFDLGDGSATYSASTGVLPSDLSLSVGFDADELEVTGPIGDAVTRAAVLGGRYDDAVARFFQVNWNSLGSGAIKLLKGYVVKADVEGGAFKLTLRSEISKFAQSVGRIITGYCDADFGDARCTKTPVVDAVTITAVTDERSFTVSNSDGRADKFFNKGTVQFTSGALNATRPVEVFSYTSAGVVTLWAPLADVPEIGDELNLRQGCYDPATDQSKTRAACMHFDNIVNFRGFPDVPGSDQVLSYPTGG